MQKTKKIPEITETLTYKSIKQAPEALKQILDHESELREIANKIKILNPTTFRKVDHHNEFEGFSIPLMPYAK